MAIIELVPEYYRVFRAKVLFSKVGAIDSFHDLEVRDVKELRDGSIRLTRNEYFNDLSPAFEDIANQGGTLLLVQLGGELGLALGPDDYIKLTTVHFDRGVVRSMDVSFYRSGASVVRLYIPVTNKIKSVISGKYKDVVQHKDVAHIVQRYGALV